MNESKCWNCGYSLDGGGPVCPECGTHGPRPPARPLGYFLGVHAETSAYFWGLLFAFYVLVVLESGIFNTVAAEWLFVALSGIQTLAQALIGRRALRRVTVPSSERWLGPTAVITGVLVTCASGAALGFLVLMSAGLEIPGVVSEVYVIAAIVVLGSAITLFKTAQY